MAVQVAGRLIRQQKSGITDDGAGDGHALFLAARELLGQMVDSILEADELQRGHDVLAALRTGEFSEQQRQLHILKRGENRNEIEGLKDVSDVGVAPVGGLRVAEAKHVLAEHQQLAGGGAVDRGDHVQQGRLARARRAHQREELAPRDFDRNVVESLHFKRIAFENLADVAYLHDFGLRRNIRNRSCAHDCPLILILSPSFKLGGAVVMTFSPPTKPVTKKPPLRWDRISTGRKSALPSKAMKTTFLPA